MPTEITMPKMGFDMEAGTLLRWLKTEGDPVKQGEVIAEIETDKATVEIESFATGVVQRVLVKEGEEVPVGTTIALVGEPGEGPPSPPSPVEKEEAAPEAKPTAPAAEAPPVAEKEVEAGAEERIKASPVARRLAAEAGIDLASLTGTGPGGRIIKDDVEQFLARRERPAAISTPAPARPAPPVQPVPAAGERQALSRMRQTIASRMTQSKTTAPHFYVTTEIDMGEAMAFRQEINATVTEDVEKVSVNDLIVRAVALALHKFPRLNASYQGDVIQVYPEINIGVAVALDEGLITPVVHQVDQKSLVELARAAKGVIERARSGKLRSDDLTGGTFTVSNLGMFDVDDFIAIINPPEAAIVAAGSVREVPVIENGEVKSAQRMKLTVSADHRVTDGAEAARFLQEVKRLLQSPLWLVL
jgi:pyruvate dehydrogenase E2 component (dihydrolipoamide acetyltransferase)